MTPAQKMSLDAKHALQRVEQLTAWLDRNRPIVADNDAALRRELKSLEVHFSGVQEAVDIPPAIGVVAEQPSARARLAAVLTQQNAEAEDERIQADDADILRRLLVQAGELETCTAIRFRASEAVMTPREHPFKASLLGLADLAAIMVRVYDLIGAGRPSDLVPSVERMTSVYEDVGRKVQASIVPGMTGRDVNGLQSLLDSLYPDSTRLKFLAAAGYWSDLEEVASHITDADRIRALSLLWDEDEEITGLLRQLVDVLAQLGYATEAFCPRDALLDRDAHSGWFIHHPRSIISAATLFDFGGSDEAGVRMVGRYGHAAVLPRPAIAAVAAEVCVFLNSNSNPILRQADVIDFPSLPPPLDLPPQGRGRGAGPGLKGELLARVYASAKALHLVDRACHCDELTSLVACCDADGDNDDLLAPSIGDWVDLVQGEEPHLREHSRTGLFVVAAQRSGGRAAAPREDAYGRELREVLAGGDEWPGEWTPGRPFSNVFAWDLEPRTDGALPTSRGARFGGSAQSGLLRLSAAIDGAGRDIATPDYAFSAEPSRLDTQRLVEGLAFVSHVGRKQRQLRRRLAELNRNTRARFLRYRADNDLVEASDWRQRIAATIEHRLARTARRGKLGRLIAALMVGDAELVAVYRRSDRAGLNQRLRQGAGAVIDLEVDYGVMAAASEKVVPRGRSITMAEAAVGYWLSAIRRSARSQRFCRRLGMADFLLEHMADEIGAGAVRMGVVRRVAEVIEVSVVRERGGEKTFAAVVGSVINGFVERLALDIHDEEASSALPVSPGQIAAMQMATVEAGRQRRDIADAWCAAFSTLVEANIANSRFASAGEASTDLARILAQFPANNLEVE